jgi:hypothetical protein
MPSQMQDNVIFIQLLISGMDSLNALARKTKEIEVERKKERKKKRKKERKKI